MKAHRFALLLAAACLLALHGCGGGGGGGGSEYRPAAEVTINASPGSIDPGDRTYITIHIWNVHPDGILLKVRYPLGLSYVKNSGHFDVEGSEFSMTPDITAEDSKYGYLVFAFSQSDFGPQGRDTGLATFQLLATKDSITGTIGVDPTIRDPSLPVRSQFDVANPLFGAKDEDNINVSGPNVNPTATPSS